MTPGGRRPSGLPATSPSLLEFSGVAHRFGRRWVLRGVQFALAPGEVVAVGGANGAGKTTLLRIGATLLRPMRGSGRVGELDLVRDAGLVRARVAFMGHSPALYEDLTAQENLAFAFRMRGRAADPEGLRSALAEVGLAEHAHARVRQFSSGMRRRLALARTVIDLPEILLMDEPYASLDREGVELVNRVIERVAARGGGVLMATHDLVAGSRVTDRTVTLQDGVILEAPTPFTPPTPPEPAAGGGPLP
jgi:heme exporter protein A